MTREPLLGENPRCVATGCLHPELQAEDHRKVGTHPGDGWVWKTNCEPEDKDRYVARLEESHGTGNVKAVDTVFDSMGEPWNRSGHSIWVLEDSEK